MRVLCHRADDRFPGEPYWHQITEWAQGKPAHPGDRAKGLGKLSFFIHEELDFMVARGHKPLQGAQGLPHCLDPFYEPSYDLANELGLSEWTLNRLMREESGLSVREWWDVKRAADPAWGIQARLRAEIEGLILCHHFKGAQHRPDVEELLKALRRERRIRGWTAQGRVWKWGFRHAARMNLAAFMLTRKTVAELEIDLLREIAHRWYWDCAKCTFFRVSEVAAPTAESQVPSPHPTPATGEAPRPWWAPDGQGHPEGGKAEVPEPEEKAEPVSATSGGSQRVMEPASVTSGGSDGDAAAVFTTSGGFDGDAECVLEPIGVAGEG